MEHARLMEVSAYLLSGHPHPTTHPRAHTHTVPTAARDQHTCIMAFQNSPIGIFIIPVGVKLLKKSKIVILCWSA